MLAFVDTADRSHHDAIACRHARRGSHSKPPPELHGKFPVGSLSFIIVTVGWELDRFVVRLRIDLDRILVFAAVLDRHDKRASGHTHLRRHVSSPRRPSRSAAQSRLSSGRSAPPARHPGPSSLTRLASAGIPTLKYSVSGLSTERSSESISKASGRWLRKRVGVGLRVRVKHRGAIERAFGTTQAPSPDPVDRRQRHAAARTGATRLPPSRFGIRYRDRRGRRFERAPHITADPDQRARSLPRRCSRAPSDVIDSITPC